MKSFVAVLGFAGLACVPAFASISFVTTAAGLGSNDSTNWSQLGGDTTSLSGGFTATSSSSVGVTGSFTTSPTDNTGLVAVVCPASPSCSWSTSGTGMNAGDTDIWAFDPVAAGGAGAGTGPISLSFGSAILGAGAWIEGDTSGAYTVQLEAFNGGTSLGSSTEASDGSGDPVFFGVLDTTAEVTKVVFSLTACGGCSNLGDFAMDTLLMTDPVSTAPTPEPASVILLGTGAAAMLGMRRLRARKSRS